MIEPLIFLGSAIDHFREGGGILQVGQVLIRHHTSPRVDSK